MRPSYVRRKTAGICTTCGRKPAHPGRIDCDNCRFMRAQQYDASLTREQWDKKEAWRTAPFVAMHMPPLCATDPLALRRIPGPALAHCGQWWPIVPGQVVCGTCGVTYEEEGCD
jgi:hypothetical protein